MTCTSQPSVLPFSRFSNCSLYIKARVEKHCIKGSFAPMRHPRKNVASLPGCLCTDCSGGMTQNTVVGKLSLLHLVMIIPHFYLKRDGSSQNKSQIQIQILILKKRKWGPNKGKGRSDITITMYHFLPDLPDHPAPPRPLIAKVSSRTASHVLSGQQQQTSTQPPKTLSKPVTQQPPPTLPKPDIQPPPTFPKPFAQSPQTQPKPQRFIQPLPKPYLQTSPQPPPKSQVPPQTPPKPQSFPQALVKSQSLPLDHSEDFSRQSVLSGDPLSPTESGGGLSDGMSSKQMSIKERWVTVGGDRCVVLLDDVFSVFSAATYQHLVYGPTLNRSCTEEEMWWMIMPNLWSPSELSLTDITLNVAQSICDADSSSSLPVTTSPFSIQQNMPAVTTIKKAFLFFAPFTQAALCKNCLQCYFNVAFCIKGVTWNGETWQK